MQGAEERRVRRMNFTPQGGAIEDNAADDIFMVNQGKQHFLYFRPLPQGHGSFRPVFGPAFGAGPLAAGTCPPADCCCDMDASALTKGRQWLKKRL